MDRELIDLTWSILPKEFKEELRFQYKNGSLEKREEMRNLYGSDNLTSDAEGEEMLAVPRKDIIELYQEALVLIDRGNRNNYLNDKLVGIGWKNVLYALFGSKCLPDNVNSLENKL